MVKPDHVPIYIAAMGPANLRLTGELADGWLANAFIPESAETFLAPLREGAAEAGASLDELDLVGAGGARDHCRRRGGRRGGAAPCPRLRVHDRRHGSGDTNFYNDTFARLGFADEVAEVERLWRAGRRDEAAEAVPLELGVPDEPGGHPATIAARISALPRTRASPRCWPSSTRLLRGPARPSGDARRARGPSAHLAHELVEVEVVAPGRDPAVGDLEGPMTATRSPRSGEWKRSTRS